jgi:hypothetical protein
MRYCINGSNSPIFIWTHHVETRRWDGYNLGHTYSNKIAFRYLIRVRAKISKP